MEKKVFQKKCVKLFPQQAWTFKNTALGSYGTFHHGENSNWEFYNQRYSDIVLCRWNDGSGWSSWNRSEGVEAQIAGE